MQLADQEMQDAVFLEAPVPLFPLERDGTVLRASRRAGHLLVSQSRGRPELIGRAGQPPCRGR